MRTPLAITRTRASKELRVAVRAETKARAQLRLRALLAVATGAHVPRVAGLWHVAERALRNWVNPYNRKGLAGLRDRRRGRRGRLGAAELAKLRARLLAEPTAADGVCRLRGVDIRRLLREEYGPAYACSSVYFFLHDSLDFSYLKPRPRHEKTDPAAQAASKKTSPTFRPKSGGSTRVGGWKSGSRTKPASASKAR